METSIPLPAASLPVHTPAASVTTPSPAPAPPSAAELDKWTAPLSLSLPERPEHGSEIVIPPGLHQQVIDIKFRQRVVLETLMAGRGLKEAARSAEVHRATIYRWMKYDPDFKAALAAWQQQALTSVRSRLLSAADGAADLLIRRAERGDLKAAIAILRSNGLFAAAQPPILQPDPAAPTAAAADAGERTSIASAQSTTAARRVRLRKGQTLEMRLRELLLSLTETSETEPEAEARQDLRTNTRTSASISTDSEPEPAPAVPAGDPSEGNAPTSVNG